MKTPYKSYVGFDYCRWMYVPLRIDLDTDK